MIKDRLCLVKTAQAPECIGKGQKDADVTRIQLCGRLIMFLRSVKLPEPPFKVGHLLKRESAVRQTPERFFVRPKRALEIAQNAVTINSLREPRFPQLRLERDRPIRFFFYRCTGVRLWINAVEIELAARNGETRPRQRKLRIKPNRLGIKRNDLFGGVEGGASPIATARK